MPQFWLFSVIRGEANDFFSFYGAFGLPYLYYLADFDKASTYGISEMSSTDVSFDFLKLHYKVIEKMTFYTKNTSKGSSQGEYYIESDV